MCEFQTIYKATRCHIPEKAIRKISAWKALILLSEKQILQLLLVEVSDRNEVLRWKVYTIISGHNLCRLTIVHILMFC